MGYNRNRSRDHANDYIVLRKGTIPSTTNLVNCTSSGLIMNRVNGSLGTEVVFDGFSVPLAGLTVYTNGTRKYYDISAIQARILSYAPQLISHFATQLNTAVDGYLSSSPPFLRIEGSESMSDVVTPDFHKLSNQGKIINSPMTKTSYFCRSAPDNSGTVSEPVLANQNFNSTGSPYSNTSLYYFSFSIRRGVSLVANGVPKTALGDFLATFTHELLDIENAVNDAFGKCYDAEADLALAIAEANKTLSHLADTGRRLFDLVKAIKTGRFDKLSPKTFSRWKKDGPISTSSNVFLDAWLEARYAWRPLILDIQEFSKYLASPSGLTPRRTFRSFDQVLDDQAIDRTFSSDGYSCRFTGNLSVISSVRAGCLTEIDLGLATYRDLGFFNPAGVLWETIPYSFVVDWFVNVKGFLASTNPNSGIKILSSWATQHSELSFTGNVLVTDLSNSVQKNIPFEYSSELKVRNVDTSPSYINLDVNLDIYKLVDAVALLRRFKH
nr:MAG: hypothetical protein 1 [Leviviridae sp.]